MKQSLQSSSFEKKPESKIDSKVEAPKRPESTPLPLDLSQDLSGTWSGDWQDCQGKTGKGGLIIKERPDFTIIGWWCEERQIQKGHRVSRDKIVFENRGNRSRKYDVIGKIKDRGRTLLLLYSYDYVGSVSSQDKMSKGSVVGLHRLTRDGASSYSDPPPTGLSGHWMGMEGLPSLPQHGGVRVWLLFGDQIDIEDRCDGRICVKYCDIDDFDIGKGERNNNKLQWRIRSNREPDRSDPIENVYGEFDPDVLRLKSIDPKEGYAVHRWYIRDDPQSPRYYLGM